MATQKKYSRHNARVWEYHNCDSNGVESIKYYPLSIHFVVSAGAY